jgi:hypothetical protein
MNTTASKITGCTSIPRSQITSRKSYKARQEMKSAAQQETLRR